MYRLFFFLVSLLTAIETFGQTLTSPDGKISFRVAVTDGVIHYDVTYQQQDIIKQSVLGVEGWQNGLKLQSVKASAKDEYWKPVYGERNRIHDHYRALTFTFMKNNNTHDVMELEARAYNEGIAFRYSFPKQAGSKSMSISQDGTEFSFPAGTKAWFTDHAQGSYKLLSLDKWPGEAERPLTLQLPNGLYAALAEAAVVDYCRTKFILAPGKPNTIACAMYDKVTLPMPFVTPWRVIMLATKATALLQNDDLLLNLNAPCAIKQTAWIKPGKVIREMSLSTAGAKKVVDFAEKRHLQYVHFDAGWYGAEEDTASDATHVNVDPARNPVNDLNMEEVVRYAKQKGIGVWVYVNKKALGKQLDDILPLYEKWGIAGIKFGFVNVGSFQWTKWLHDAVKKCAQHHLLVDIHDEYRPTGFSRTYPNLLTQEGVRGNEEMPDANNNATLPFTRFLCGAADYTICYYHRPELKKRLAETQNSRVLKTTSVHQMALSVVYYSPLQFMYWYDKPEDSQDEPELDFFDRVPTVWDDTQVLDGEIGQYITIARKHNKEWFVGSITNNDARDLHINCSFLSPGKKYKATIYYDDPASAVRTKVSVKSITVDASTVLDSHLLPSGGQAILLTPLN
ncbi:MAG: glycoside hydrolase family 97 catalytic domain-containing protein [Chitinophaga sp.]|uniref:glycoside hydrolase family 97 protein n=1 Tax=Chitinophaga sp. TaxID=1869181 RepID=UPI0025C45547|nr:glycoside hydrolase family 97 protein [Chitinophaga sp.]MBV8252071.1 glycoside hydrolase family 97 catalytic domain-containing protein [Chitinophaga sp.]